MAVLVTGGAGYIGSHVVARLLARGEQVTVLDNLSTGNRAAVPAGATFVEGAVQDTALLARLFSETKYDCVLHFAAALIVPESVSNPLKYYANNVGGMLSLLQAATAAAVPHIIFSSTAATYGMPAVSRPIRETDEQKPINPYGSSKLAAEFMLQETALAHGLTYVILRYFNVAGAALDGNNGQRSKNATHLIKVAAEAALGKRPGMGIFGTDYETPDGTCIRDYIHVEDLAAAHLAALDYLRAGKPSTIANCGYSKGYSVREVIDMVKQVSGADFKVDEVPRRAGDPALLVADCSRAREVLGWQPQHDDLREIVASALAWERKLEAA